MKNETDSKNVKNDFREKGYVDLPLQEGQANEKDGPAGKGLMNQHSAIPESDANTQTQKQKQKK